jgi:MFS family permease
LPNSISSEPVIAVTNFNVRQQWTYLSILLLIATSCYIDRGVISVLLPAIKKEFQLSDVGLGLLSGAPFAICYALASIPLGRLADATSRKNVLLISLVTWSTFTGLCGVTSSLVMLFVLRMGVGAAEGGAVPSGHALIAEYFPPQRRALAFAVFAAAPMLGVAVANGAGGWIAQNYGWRAAFIAMAMLAVPVAIAGALILKEPSRRTGHAQAADKASFWTDLKVLFTKRSFLLVIVGSILISFYSQGMTTFLPSLMVRSLGLSVAEAGATFGLASLVGSLIGMVASGALGNYLSRRGARALLLMAVVAICIAALFAIVAFSSHNVFLFVVMTTGTVAALTGSLPAIFTSIQHVCGPTRRALADSVNLATVIATGMTLGPIAVGLLSETFIANGVGDESLRYAMLTITLVLPVSALLLFLAASHLAHDAE